MLNIVCGVAFFVTAIAFKLFWSYEDGKERKLESAMLYVTTAFCSAICMASEITAVFDLYTEEVFFELTVICFGAVLGYSICIAYLIEKAVKKFKKFEIFKYANIRDYAKEDGLEDQCYDECYDDEACKNEQEGKENINKK